jgi:flagellar biogenesis protein FliO
MALTLRIARRDMQGGTGSQIQTGLAAWLLARSRGFFQNGLAGMGGARARRRMELVETLQLGGKRQLMLVTCEGRRYLVGAGGDSVHSIAEMPPATDARAEETRCAR